MYVCTYLSMHVYVHVCVYIPMYVCVILFFYLFMYLFMYLFVCLLFIHIYINNKIYSRRRSRILVTGRRFCIMVMSPHLQPSQGWGCFGAGILARVVAFGPAALGTGLARTHGSQNSSLHSGPLLSKAAPAAPQRSIGSQSHTRLRCQKNMAATENPRDGEDNLFSSKNLSVYRSIYVSICVDLRVYI